MTATPLEEIQLTTPSRHDPLLDLYHNTRHASRRHALLRGMHGWQVRSPWLSRFDWVIDAPLEAEPGERGRTILTKRRATPRSVFVKAGWLDSFVEHLLPALEKPVTLYMGNANHPLSRCAGGLHRLLGHPMVHAIFCENKDLDLSPITAMPVGLHPADMLHEAGALRLRALESEVDPAGKDRRILVPYGGATERFGAAMDAPDVAPEVAFPYDGIEKLEEYWRCLARYRFLLVPWQLPHDSPAPFEALILGTIPILRAGPLAEAYRGLPVVSVDRLSEITPKKLDEWWEMYAGGFADSAITSPAYWWSKVAARLPGRKRAFLVLGPESHGNHLVTDLLVHAGCHGRSGNHLPWDGEWQEGIDDSQPWDEELPTDENPIVWRRSVPHLKHWPDIRRMVDALERRGYVVHAIVVHRDRYAAIQSQLKWRHVADAETARGNIERAYPYIFAHLQAAAVKSTVVSYESLVNQPAAQDDLLEELGLDLPDERLEVWDGNRKWYDSRAQRPRAAAPKTSAAARQCADFGEWWFPCDASVRQAYEQRVAVGYARMRTSSVVFCGLARDVADVLPQVAARIEHAGGMFGEYRVVIYENDSCDGTVARLREWQESNPRVGVLSETLGAVRWGRVCEPERMRYLAACRNRYLEHATDRYGAFDYLIALDTDLPRGFSYEGLAHTFGGEEWDVVGSNLLSLSALSEGPAPPRPEFFDAWAFRWPGDVEPRPFTETNALVFQRGEPLVPVWSAFGGLAVYSMAAIRSGARYGGDDCEHVVLHRRLRERGFDRQFLNPSQIVLYVEGLS